MNTEVLAKVLQVSMIAEWLFLLSEKRNGDKAIFDLNTVKNPLIRDSLKLMFRGAKDFKRAMVSVNRIQDEDFNAMQDFSAERMEVAVSLMRAFMNFEDKELMLILGAIETTAMKIKENRENGEPENED